MTSWFSSHPGTQAISPPTAERAAAGSPDSFAESTNTSIAGFPPSHDDPTAPPVVPKPSPLFDPFSGASLGEILPPDSREANANELWQQMNKIMTLQSKLSDMHAKMEGIGTRKQQKRHEKPTLARRRQSDIVGGNTDSGVEDGIDDDVDEEAEESRKRDEEFAKLDARFEGRTEAITEIWASLDNLSEALSAFHTLQSQPIKPVLPNAIDATSNSPLTASRIPPRPTKSPAFGGSAMPRSSSPLASTSTTFRSHPPPLPMPNSGQRAARMSPPILRHVAPLAESPTELTPSEELSDTPLRKRQ